MRLYPVDHPIFAQRIFTDQTLINSLRTKVILKHHYCNETEMWAQGVPAVITISREIREFRQHYNATCNKFDGQFDRLHEAMTRNASSLPQQVVDIIRSQLVIQGAVQVTSADIYRIVSEILDAPGGRMDAISVALNSISQQLATQQHSVVSDATDQQTQPSQVATGTFHMWPDSESIHSVPFGFEWPSHTTNTMWNLWFLGDRSKRIWPFKNIIPRFDLRGKLSKSNRCRTKRVMKKMISIAIAGELISCEQDVKPINMQSIYDYSYPLLVQSLYGGEMPMRPQDININTLANRMPKVTGRRPRVTRRRRQQIEQSEDSEDNDDAGL